MIKMIDKEEVLKIASLAIPPAASIFSGVLMLNWSPPKNTRDLVNRLMASFLSSFTIGTSVLIYLTKHTSVLTDAGIMSSAVFGEPNIGKILVSGSVFAVTGLVGWAIVSGAAKWLNKHGDSVIERALNKASGNEKKSD